MKRIVEEIGTHLAVNLNLCMQDTLLLGFFAGGQGYARAHRPSRRVAYRKWRLRRAAGRAK